MGTHLHNVATDLQLVSTQEWIPSCHTPRLFPGRLRLLTSVYMELQDTRKITLLPRQQTGQYSSSRVWVTTQSPNLSTVHTGENFRFMLPLVWVQAHISMKCTQVAHERGTSPHLPDWQLVFVGSLSSGCSHTVWMLETMWLHGIRLRNSLFQPELI